MKQVTLKTIKEEYKISIEKTLAGRKRPDVDELIDISLALFHEIKVKGIPDDDKDADALLFQYGTYDWGKGESFQFDITRQFIKPDEDEPYQLSMTLHFEPVECKDYNCWSFDVKDLVQWVQNIKNSKGYELAKSAKCKRFKIDFEQC